MSTQNVPARSTMASLQTSDAASTLTETTDNTNRRQRSLIIGGLATGVIVLVGLVAALTLIPAQTLSSTVTQQIAQQQQAIAQSLAGQVESLFNISANDLLSLAGRDEIRSDAVGVRPTARLLLNNIGLRRGGQVKSIARLGTDGTALYGWPDMLENRIENNQPLDWRVDARIMFALSYNGGVQLVRPNNTVSATYLLIAPVNSTSGASEAIAMEIDLNTYLKQGFATVKLPDTAQVWAFDPDNNNQLIYQQRTDIPWTGTSYDFLTNRNVQAYPDFPTVGRNSVSAPIYTAFTSDRTSAPSLVLLISHPANEGSDVVYGTLNSLFFGGVAFVMILSAMAAGIGRFFFIEESRRRREQQRRSTVRSLLEMSRTLNSSLDLPVVLRKILEELAQLLPHDSASVMLIDKEADEPTLRTAARHGNDLEQEREFYPLVALRGAREVMRSGKPVLINDTLNDQRWSSESGSPQVAAWLGVPLQIREQPLGVLNINSFHAGRFGADEAELAKAFADQACVAIENASAHELQIRQYESELETAHAIQTSLLPREVPPMPQIDLNAQSFPARHVSGDYYQYLAMPDGRLGIAIGDVSGKGIPAALLMAVITTALREEILRHESPAALLNSLNASLIDRMRQNNMNSALMLALFDPTTRRIEIANGGMVQPYVRTPSGWEFVPVGGYPLGLTDRSNYSAKTVTLAPGSAVVFISDGVIEAQNAAGEMFGFERFESLLGSLPVDLSSETLIERILQAVRYHLNGLEAQDDITVLVIRSVEL